MQNTMAEHTEHPGSFKRTNYRRNLLKSRNKVKPSINYERKLSELIATL